MWRSVYQGVTRVALSRVLNGKAAVSADMALRRCPQPFASTQTSAAGAAGEAGPVGGFAEEATEDQQDRDEHGCVTMLAGLGCAVGGDTFNNLDRAEFGADGVGDGVGVVVHEGFGFGFDHDAGEGFGAGVADDDAAGVGESCSAAAMAAATVGIWSSGRFSRT